jgi:ABC-type multidrug transport system permease subunit
MRDLHLAPLALVLLFAASPASAYIGPGAGAGTIAVVIGVLAAVVMAFFAILWYPMKRALRKRKDGDAGRKA